MANVLVLLAATTSALAVGAVYVRWMEMARGAIGDDPEARAGLLRRRRDTDSDD